MPRAAKTVAAPVEADEPNPAGDEDISDADFDNFFAEGANAPPPPPVEDDDEPGDGEGADADPGDASGAEKGAKPNGKADQAKADAAKKDGERDYRQEYTNTQVALKEARAETKAARAELERLGRTFEQAMARFSERQRPEPQQAKPADDGIPKVDADLAARVARGDYKDPLEQMRDQGLLLSQQAQALNWFANTYKGNVERTRTESARAQADAENDRRRTDFIEGVARDVRALVPAEQAEDFNAAYVAVLDRDAQVIYRSPTARAYLARGYSQQEVAKWAYQQANEALHLDAADLMRAEKDPVKALMDEARRGGWRAPSEVAADKKVKEEAEAAKAEAEREAEGASAKKREKARDTLSASLSKGGKSGGGVQSLKDLADANLEGSDFDDYFDKLTGYER